MKMWIIPIRAAKPVCFLPRIDSLLQAEDRLKPQERFSVFWSGRKLSHNSKSDPCYPDGLPNGDTMSQHLPYFASFRYTKLAPIRPTHDRLQRLSSRAQHQVCMIGHQTVAVHTAAAFFPIFRQYHQKPVVILIVFKYLLPVDSPQHDVIDAAFASLSALPRHRTSSVSTVTYMIPYINTEIRPRVFRKRMAVNG